VSGRKNEPRTYCPLGARCRANCKKLPSDCGAGVPTPQRRTHRHDGVPQGCGCKEIEHVLCKTSKRRCAEIAGLKILQGLKKKPPTTASPAENDQLSPIVLPKRGIKRAAGRARRRFACARPIRPPLTLLIFGVRLMEPCAKRRWMAAPQERNRGAGHRRAEASFKRPTHAAGLRHWATRY